MEKLINVKKVQKGGSGCVFVYFSKEVADKLQLKPKTKLAEKLDLEQKRIIYEVC